MATTKRDCMAMILSVEVFGPDGELLPPDRHATAFAPRPKAQRLYVDTVTGDMGIFDSWASWPNQIGFYQLSTKRFVRLRPRQMREATVAEARAFQRAKRAGVEATA